MNHWTTPSPQSSGTSNGIHRVGSFALTYEITKSGLETLARTGDVLNVQYTHTVSQETGDPYLWVWGHPPPWPGTERGHVHEPRLDEAPWWTQVESLSLQKFLKSFTQKLSGMYTWLTWGGGGEGRAIVDTHNLCAVRTCSITLFNKNVGPLASSDLTTTKTQNTCCSHVTNLARIIMANSTNQQKAMNFLHHVWWWRNNGLKKKGEEAYTSWLIKSKWKTKQGHKQWYGFKGTK